MKKHTVQQQQHTQRITLTLGRLFISSFSCCSAVWNCEFRFTAFSNICTRAVCYTMRFVIRWLHPKVNLLVLPPFKARVQCAFNCWARAEAAVGRRGRVRRRRRRTSGTTGTHCTHMTSFLLFSCFLPVVRSLVQVFAAERLRLPPILLLNVERASV